MLVDIFEVLIVIDRLYKKVKFLSVVIDILVKMVDDEYIDCDVFELFLILGIYLKYVK